MKFLVIYLISMTVVSAFGQLNKPDIFGEWICENTDSAYYKSKYITLYSDSSFRNQSKECDFVKWTIDSKGLNFTNINKCVQPGYLRISASLGKKTIDLRKVKRRQVLELTNRGHRFDKFEIVGFERKKGDNLRDIRILKLKRV